MLRVSLYLRGEEAQIRNYVLQILHNVISCITIYFHNLINCLVHDNCLVVVEHVNHIIDAGLTKGTFENSEISNGVMVWCPCVGHINLVAKKKKSEFLPQVELGDSSEVVAQAYINFNAILGEVISKESESTREKNKC